MLGRVKPLRAVRLLLLLSLAVTGCRTLVPDVDQRTPQGPAAVELWTLRMVQQTGREPTFEEKRLFQNDLDDRIGRYLREHEEAASSTTLMSFRGLNQVTVGMDKGQVEVLLGAPLRTTRDAAEMESLARRHWPDIRGKSDEAWTYPYGWVIYFSNSRVVDITQYRPGSLASPS